jgi:hypothetical protein
MCSLVRDDPRRFVTSGTAPGGLETVPSNESHLACRERISVGGKVQQTHATIFRARVDAASPL